MDKKVQDDKPLDQTQAEIYAKREKVYAREVHGLFANLRVLAMVGLLGAYYGTAWISWNGQQILLFDLPARKFYVFGLVFWPQDFFYLAMLLVIAALSLFFFTALAGRLWCGYACPQTVWTEIFMWFERKIEGDRNAQMKLDKQPLNARKLRIKLTKHAVWIAFSLWTGFTFVGYFTPIRELWQHVIHFSTGPWETFWILFYGFATYGNAGWMREQVCIYMCPYARFQSAMFDRNTLIISYDAERGEPRGARRRETDHVSKGLGDCINCTLCKQVCPTGIDIREGLQYQCIGCAACVDVCDQVMDKMGYPRGLIRYTTENAMEGRPARLLRPRVLIYATLLLVLVGGLIYGVVTRTPLEMDIIRDRNALYRETPDGLTENVYTIRLINMDEKPHRLVLGVAGLPGIHFGRERTEYNVQAGAVLSVPVSVRVDPGELKQMDNRIEFSVKAEDDPKLNLTEQSRFLGPVIR